MTNIQEIYQDTLKFAAEKHADQKVPGTNSNYLLHISNVAMEVLIAYSVEKSFDISFAIQVAILHDTIEDTSTDFLELEQNFGTRVAKAVDALTKNDNLNSKREKIQDSLNRINELEDEVGLVKIADRITNLQKPPTTWNQEKINNYYNEAIFISENLKNKNPFLNNRLLEKIEEYKGCTSF